MSTTRLVVRLLGLLLLAVSTVAQPAETPARRESEQRRTEPARDRESVRERRVDAGRLPAEFRRSWLFQHEVKDPRTGEERGVTLRTYVAERPTREAIIEQMALREQAAEVERRLMPDGGGAGPWGEPTPSMYIDLSRAERATAESIREHRAQIEAWQRLDSARTLELRMDHDYDIGVVLLREKAGDAGKDQVLLSSRSSIVRLAKVGEGGFYVRESLPSGMTAREAAGIREAQAGSIRDVNKVGGDMNCVNCAIATDATLAGRPASALGGGPYRTDVLEKTFGRRFGAPSTIDGVSRAIVDAGNGARGIVYGSRGADQVGHVFNVVNQGGTVRFLDGQTGRAAVTDGFVSFQLLRTD